MSDNEYSGASDDEICTECPANLEHTRKRFQAPYMLAQAGIPCLILGADALALVFWVPIFGSVLHIVVEDNFLDQALELIRQELGYEIASPKKPFGTNIMLEQDCGYLNCRYLESVSKGADPSYILIHPETNFNVSIWDYNCSTPVDEFLDAPLHQDIRLPTRKLMVDMIIDTLLHTEANLVVTQQGFMQLSCWLSDIVYSTSLRPPVVGDLSSDAKTLLASVKEENRPFLEMHLRGGRCEIDSHREDRRVSMM